MGAVEGGFQLGSSIITDFHKDHLEAELSVDRKVGEWRQGAGLGGCCDNTDLKKAVAMTRERRDRYKGW